MMTLNNRLRKRADAVRFEIATIKYLWLLILLPKPIQLCIFGITAIRLIQRRLLRVRVDNVALLLCAGALVQLTAIVVQMVFASPSFDRVAAAFNTCLMWLISAVFYWGAKANPWNRKELRLAVRYFLCNLLILSALYCLYLMAPTLSFTVLGQEYKLSGRDFMDLGEGGAGYRFRGFMETYLSPSHLFLITVPVLAIGAERGYVKKGTAFVVMAAAYAAVMGSHSRMGMITCTAMAFLMFFHLLIVADREKQLSRVLVVVCVFAFTAFCIGHWSVLQEMLVNFFNARSGSNDLRFSLYRESLRMVLENQPLIGMGVKYSYTPAVPYGSHCTYIGLLYKGGLLGGFFVLSGLVLVLKRCVEIPFSLVVKSMFLVYPVFLIFSDIDSSNWVIAAAFIAWGIASACFSDIDAAETSLASDDF